MITALTIGAVLAVAALVLLPLLLVLALVGLVIRGVVALLLLPFRLLGAIIGVFFGVVVGVIGLTFGAVALLVAGVVLCAMFLVPLLPLALLGLLTPGCCSGRAVRVSRRSPRSERATLLVPSG